MVLPLTIIRASWPDPQHEPILAHTTVPDKQNRQILLNAYFSLKSPEKEFLKNAP